MLVKRAVKSLRTSEQSVMNIKKKTSTPKMKLDEKAKDSIVGSKEIFQSKGFCFTANQRMPLVTASTNNFTILTFVF